MRSHLCIPMNSLQKAKQIIAENLYMTISVSSQKGKPWIANLYYVYDKDYNFYWYSPKDSQHSTYIRENPQVAISIFDSQAIGDDIDAVYIQAKAYEITAKKEILKGCFCYASKMLQTKFIGKKEEVQKFIKQYRDFQGISALRMYKAVPVKIWKLAPYKIFKDKFIESRIEVKL